MAARRRPGSKPQSRSAGRPARVASSSRVKPGGVLRFDMRSTRTAVPPAVERILSHVDAVGLSENQRADLAIALSEALANAAIHGNKLQSVCPVSVSVRLASAEAVIEIRDCGHGFDHAHVSDPTSDEQVLMPGGRGVFLMRHLVDRLEYNRAGNRVRLTVKRH